MMLEIVAAGKDSPDLLNDFGKNLTDDQKKELSSYFAIGGHIYPKDVILRNASFIEDNMLRQVYIMAILANNRALPDNERKQLTADLIKKARVLNRLMLNHNINYNQALAWNLPEMHVWVKQLKDKTSIFPQELFAMLTSEIQSLSPNEVNDLIEKMTSDQVTMREAIKKGGIFAQTNTPEEPDIPTTNEKNQPKQHR